jgi:hypothetical protein
VCALLFPLEQAKKICDDAIRSVFKIDVVVDSTLVLIPKGKILVTRFPSVTSTRIPSHGFMLGRIVGRLSNFKEYDFLGFILKSIFIMYLRWIQLGPSLSQS